MIFMSGLEKSCNFHNRSARFSVEGKQPACQVREQSGQNLMLEAQAPGATFHFARGQHWHTNRLFQVLCATRALPLTSCGVNFGTQIAYFRFCVPAGLCLSPARRSTLAHKSLISGFVCHPGSVSQMRRGQLWHTNWLNRNLCASPALSPGSFAVNVGTQIGLFEVCVPRRLRFSHIRRGKMKNLWHTNCPNLKSCATPPQPTPKNEKYVAHKLQELEIVCHPSSTSAKK